MSGYTIIDADTHVTETPDLWTSRAPARMRDRVPHVVTGADGTQRWLVGVRRPLANVGMTANRRSGEFQAPAQELRRDASGSIRCQRASEVHGPDGYLGDGHVSERWRLR